MNDRTSTPGSPAIGLYSERWISEHALATCLGVRWSYVSRWMTYGLMGRQLEHWSYSGRRYSSLEAFERFASELHEATKGKMISAATRAECDLVQVLDRRRRRSEGREPAALVRPIPMVCDARRAAQR